MSTWHLLTHALPAWKAVQVTWPSLDGAQMLYTRFALPCSPQDKRLPLRRCTMHPCGLARSRYYGTEK